MDKKLIGLLALVILASGCINNIDSDLNSDSASSGGLKVASFSASDSTVTENQKVRITLNLENYNTQEVEIEDISLFNKGELKVSRQRECNPSPDSLESKKKEIVPQMECSWVLEAESLEDFSSQNVPLKLNLAYKTSFEPQKPLAIHFKPLEDIENTNPVEKSYSNGEINLVIRTQSPVPVGQTENVDLDVKSTGKGRVDSDNFKFSYTPEGVFEDCPDTQKIIQSEARFSCGIKLDQTSSRETTRNLLVSTSYKYVKQPSLDIKVVNQ